MIATPYAHRSGSHIFATCHGVWYVLVTCDLRPVCDLRSVYAGHAPQTSKRVLSGILEWMPAALASEYAGSETELPSVVEELAKAIAVITQRLGDQAIALNDDLKASIKERVRP